MRIVNEYYETLEEDAKSFFGTDKVNQYLSYFDEIPWKDWRRNKFDHINKSSGSDILNGYNSESYSALWLQESFTVKDPPENHELIHEVFKSEFPGNTYLEYGCGSGNLGIWALEYGACTCTFLDIPSDYFKFLWYRSDKYRWPIDCMAVDDDLPNFNFAPNIVVCNEVLEHVNNPIKTLWNISRQMPMGGKLYLSTFFNDCFGEDPSHLEWNNVFQDTNLWLEIVRKLGFDVWKRDKNGVEKWFVKNREVKWNLASRFSDVKIWD